MDFPFSVSTFLQLLVVKLGINFCSSKCKVLRYSSLDGNDPVTLQMSNRKTIGTDFFWDVACKAGVY